MYALECDTNVPWSCASDIIELSARRAFLFLPQDGGLDCGWQQSAISAELNHSINPSIDQSINQSIDQHLADILVLCYPFAPSPCTEPYSPKKLCQKLPVINANKPQLLNNAHIHNVRQVRESLTADTPSSPDHPNDYPTPCPGSTPPPPRPPDDNKPLYTVVPVAS